MPAYVLRPGWETGPDGTPYEDVPDVAIDRDGNVLVLVRKPRAAVHVFTREHEHVATWGHDTLSADPHGITVAPDGTVYVVDRGADAVLHHTATGRLLRTLSGRFAMPTALAVAPDGDLFVSDGYRHTVVHRFAPDGTHRRTWGEFDIPHHVAFDAAGRLWVADREHHRIQAFTVDGALVETIPAHRPCAVLPHAGGLLVAELGATVSAIQDGSRTPVIEGLTAAHGLALDDRGAVYVAEVTDAFTRGQAPAGTPALRKYELSR